MTIDATDQRLIAALRRNARASISTLAADLNLSRATVRGRIDRLLETGAITRFTVETSGSEERDLVRAVVMIRLEGSMSRQVIRALSGLPQIVRLHTTNGAWDMVAEIECESLPAFDRALRSIREVRGVLGSESCLLLSTIAT